MIIESSAYAQYRVLDIQMDITPSTDITELESAIDRYLDKGTTNIALSFTRLSYLSTKALAVLVRCTQRLTECGGTLAIIKPNKDIMEVLNITDVKNLIRVVDAVEELA